MFIQQFSMAGLLLFQHGTNPKIILCGPPLVSLNLFGVLLAECFHLGLGFFHVQLVGKPGKKMGKNQSKFT